MNAPVSPYPTGGTRCDCWLSVNPTSRLRESGSRRPRRGSRKQFARIGALCAASQRSDHDVVTGTVPCPAPFKRDRLAVRRPRRRTVRAGGGFAELHRGAAGYFFPTRLQRTPERCFRCRARARNKRFRCARCRSGKSCRRRAPPIAARPPPRHRAPAPTKDRNSPRDRYGIAAASRPGSIPAPRSRQPPSRSRARSNHPPPTGRIELSGEPDRTSAAYAMYRPSGESRGPPALSGAPRQSKDRNAVNEPSSTDTQANCAV